VKISFTQAYTEDIVQAHCVVSSSKYIVGLNRPCLFKDSSYQNSSKTNFC